MTTFVVTVDHTTTYVSDCEIDAVEMAETRLGEGVPVTVHAYRHYREPSHRTMVGFRWWNADGCDRFWSVQRDGRLVCGLERFEERE